MAPSVTMSALIAGLKTEDAPPRSAVVVSRGDAQTSLSSAEESAKPKVAILPFSVEALMADRKPSREAPSPDVAVSVPGTSQVLGKGSRMGSYGALDSPVPALAVGSPFSVGDIMSMPEDVLIKPESPDAKERTSWIQSPRFSPTPPRKFQKDPKRLCTLSNSTLLLPLIVLTVTGLRRSTTVITSLCVCAPEK